MTIFVYLFNRFLYRITEFFRHWYLNSFKIYSHFVFSLLEKFDRYFAFKITLKHFFEPLYQDRSFIGYVLGFIFRSGRLMAGGIFYVILLLFAAGVYLIWLAFPVFIIFKILTTAWL